MQQPQHITYGYTLFDPDKPFAIAPVILNGSAWDMLMEQHHSHMPGGIGRFGQLTKRSGHIVIYLVANIEEEPQP